MATFIVSAAKPPVEPNSISLSDHLLRLNKGTVRISSNPSNTINTLYSNGFVGAAFSAYNDHYHLVIRPDDVWIAIMVAFANYVDAHAEHMRSIFVSHQEKEKLVIEVINEDWNNIVDLLTSQVEKRLKQDIKEWVIPAFSTTTAKDRLVGGATLLGVMKKYFSYKWQIMCGLPSVTLEGTLDDWKQIRAKADRLKDFRTSLGSNDLLEKWHSILTPVLDQFVEAYTGNVDCNFWNQICNYIGGGSGPSFISGWINVFVPFVDGKWIIKTIDQLKRKYNGEFPYGLIEKGDIATGYVEVPLEVDNNGDKFNAVLYAGHILATYEKETNKISPSVDYAVFRVK